jgi:predicted secreted Zn-dependent protease
MTRTLGETMKRTFVSMIAWVCGSLVMASPLPADERAEIKQRIEALRAEARELARHGDEDAASNRMEKVRELSARLRKLSSSELQADPHRSEKAEREEMLHRLARRLDHMRAASEHLKEAELPDMAHEVGRRAEELERKLQSEKERFAAELEQVEKHQGEKAKEKMPPIVAQRMKEEGSREEHEAWGRKVKEELARYSEVINDIRAEQEKMRREFKELRKLIERLHRDKERG